MREKLITSSAEHEALYQDLCKVLAKHEHLPRPEMLAVAANLLGKLMAIQDQRTMTAEQAYNIISRNIMHGNAQAIAALDDTQGTA